MTNEIVQWAAILAVLACVIFSDRHHAAWQEHMVNIVLKGFKHFSEEIHSCKNSSSDHGSK